MRDVVQQAVVARVTDSVEVLTSKAHQGKRELNSPGSSDEPSPIVLSPEEFAQVERVDFRTYATTGSLRRWQNIDQKLEDYPSVNHILPTKLGNILRKFEDDTKYEEVESLVEDTWDYLPASLRMNHDEHRSRLDLYCSMFFVLWMTSLIAFCRFLPTHWLYSAGALCIGAIASWLDYRAALVSARRYGRLLPQIAAIKREHEKGLVKRTRLSRRDPQATVWRRWMLSVRRAN